MILKYQEGDLLKLPRTYYLAHCISADYALGAVIAKQINDVFQMRFKLKNRFGDISERYRVGKTYMVDNVFNLIAKEKYWHKPTYRSLKCSLYKMKDIIVDKNITQLAVPRIGCGLDKLCWDKVENIIEEVFGNTDIEITIYSLPKREEN